MDDSTYNSMANVVRRFDPDHDVDRLHDAFVETRSNEPGLLVYRARQRAMDERRQRRRCEAKYLAIRCPIRVSTEPIEEMHLEEVRRSVREVLGTLEPDEKLLAHLTWWEQLSPGEIAVKLGRPRATIYTQLRRLRDRMSNSIRLAAVASYAG